MNSFSTIGDMQGSEVLLYLADDGLLEVGGDGGVLGLLLDEHLHLLQKSKQPAESKHTADILITCRNLSTMVISCARRMFSWYIMSSTWYL